MSTTVSYESRSETILAPLDATIPRVRKPALYQLGAFVVACVMVLLPIIYLALIAALAYALYFHAVHDVVILQGSGSIRGRLIAYIAPLVIGGAMLFFMVKPLFAPRRRRAEPHVVSRDAEPLLFAFVDKLCRLVGSPAPREIVVDCEVNASASFRRGFLSFLGNDLTLTVGLPLVRGFNLRQLTGVLAHEFGHFTQGAGMRLTYVVRGISYWFARVVYERDSWDEGLISASKESGSALVNIVLGIARGGIWLTRRILWALMKVGQVVSAFLLRQMEYDADRYEVRVAGSDAFADTFSRLRDLSVGAHAAHNQLATSWREKRLTTDLPELIVEQADAIPEDVRARIAEQAAAAQTGSLDTHPSDSDRVESARREDAPGVFHLGAAATTLFKDLDELSQAVTRSFYEDVLGIRLDAVSLVDTGDMLAEAGERAEIRAATKRYFMGSALGVNPFFPGDASMPPVREADEARRSLEDVRASVAAAAPQAHKAKAGLIAADTHVITRTVGDLLTEIKAEVDWGKLQMPIETRESGGAVSVEAAEAVRTRSRLAMRPLHEALASRLSAALSCLQLPEVSARLDPGVSEETERCLETLAALRRALPSVETARQTHGVLMVLLSQLGGNERHGVYVRRVKRASEELGEQLGAIRSQLSDVRYPFAHADETTSVGVYCVGDVPPGEAVGDIASAADRALERYFEIYFRSLGKLARVAELVEGALGFEPLAMPEAVSEGG